MLLIPPPASDLWLGSLGSRGGKAPRGNPQGLLGQRHVGPAVSFLRLFQEVPDGAEMSARPRPEHRAGPRWFRRLWLIARSLSLNRALGPPLRCAWRGWDQVSANPTSPFASGSLEAPGGRPQTPGEPRSSLSASYGPPASVRRPGQRFFTVLSQRSCRIHSVALPTSTKSA